MLKRLYINNFALINEMDVEFPGGLTVITGETGAGKSIFLEALGLVLGKRAEQAALKNKSKKCIIEAEFISEADLTAFFETQGIDPDKNIVLRREIGLDGKSRCFLNDSIIGLAALKELSEKLVDIHSQHQTLLLNQSNFQLDLIDAFAGTQKLCNSYKQDYNSLCKVKAHISELEQQELQARKDKDYFEFQYKELDDSDLRPGVVSRVEQEVETLENAESIKASLVGAAQVLSGEEQSVLNLLSRARQLLNGISKYDKKYEELSARISSAYIDLKESVSEIEDYESRVEANNEKLDNANSKLDSIYRLYKKHGVQSEEELLSIKEDLQKKLEGFNSLEHNIEKAKREARELQAKCKEQAVKLSKMRKSVVPAIQGEVENILEGLSMNNAHFKILLDEQELGPSGIDSVKFLFSANKGLLPEELHRVASGGELSRLMLSLKAILAAKKKLPTIIFDEIDTGVSGDVADRIGGILLQMGDKMQVITITHLPQMASKGSHHLYVYKKDSEDKTVSYIRELSRTERINEIAKMLSTSNPTQTALKNAKELLDA
jgi:DNA repair protein RecN (Recombination protein N)